LKIFADALVHLPFPLHFCAEGPDIDPITTSIDGFNATLYFPPSLSEGTDGKGIFGTWAWWTGNTLRVVLETELVSLEVDGLIEIHTRARLTGNKLLSIFLTSCRLRLDRPEIFPVAIPADSLSIYQVHEDGSMQILDGPDTGIFFQNMPADPPLATSINTTTLERLKHDLESKKPAPVEEMLRLDARLLRSRGETERAAVIEDLARQANLISQL
jgi:hypothetical protein